MRLTLRSNLAMRTLMHCAVNSGRTVRKTDIALACGASENHLGLVIHHLAQAGYVETVRGRNGGLRLARPPDSIVTGRVLRLFEGEVALADCFGSTETTCPLVPTCRLRGALGRALGAFYAVLDGVTLTDLVEDNSGLRELLLLPDDSPAQPPEPAEPAANSIDARPGSAEKAENATACGSASGGVVRYPPR